jgi:hypothetical protein
MVIAMPYCAACGKYSDSESLYCRNCGSMIQGAPLQAGQSPVPPPSAFPPSASYPWGMPPPGPVSAADVEQERYLARFSWGSGCWLYYLTSPLILYLLLAVVLGFFTGGLGQIAIYIWVGTFARRRRWEKLPWTTFERYKKDEGSWELVGIIVYVILAISTIILMIVMVSAMISGIMEANP